MAVRGPKAQGRYQFSAEKHGGRWSLTGGRLDVGEQELDVLACLADAAAAPPAGRPGAAGGGVVERAVTPLQLLDELGPKCAGGDWNQCYVIAELYARGQGVTKDPVLAKAYLEKACRAGLAKGQPAMCQLAATVYDQGKEVPRDPAAAAYFRGLLSRH
jgi:TPR repeat protein